MLARIMKRLFSDGFSTPLPLKRQKHHTATAATTERIQDEGIENIVEAQLENLKNPDPKLRLEAADSLQYTPSKKVI